MNKYDLALNWEGGGGLGLFVVWGKKKLYSSSQ